MFSAYWKPLHAFGNSDFEEITKLHGKRLLELFFIDFFR